MSLIGGNKAMIMIIGNGTVIVQVNFISQWSTFSD